MLQIARKSWYEPHPAHFKVLLRPKHRLYENPQNWDVKSLSLHLFPSYLACDHLPVRQQKTSRNEQPALVEVCALMSCMSHYLCQIWVGCVSGVSVHLFVIIKYQQGSLLTGKQLFMLCMTGYTVNTFQYSTAIINRYIALGELLCIKLFKKLLSKYIHTPSLHSISFIINYLHKPKTPQGQNYKQPHTDT